MINHRLKQLREGGLLDKYISDGLEKVGNLESGSKTRETRGAVPLSLNDLEAIFLLYSALLVLGFMVFFGELLANCVMKTKTTRQMSTD